MTFAWEEPMSTTPTRKATLDLDQPVPELVAAAREQYLTDFVELLAHRTAHPTERWVAYHGRERIGYGTSKTELVQACRGRGLALGEFLVLGIDPAVITTPTSGLL